MVFIDRLPGQRRIGGEPPCELLVSISPLLSELAPMLCGHVRCCESDTGRQRCSSRVECSMSLGFQLSYYGTAPVYAGAEDIEE